MRSLVPLGLAAVLLAQASLAAPAHRWRTYVNARFGYSLCYPADLLRPQRESDNGDGRVFLGSDGTELRVWGQYNVLENSLAEIIREDETRLAADGSRITYRAMRASWYVLSGRSRDKVFYLRRHLSGDRSAGFELQYRANAAGLWNPVAMRLSRCFNL